MKKWYVSWRTGSGSRMTECVTGESAVDAKAKVRRWQLSVAIEIMQCVEAPETAELSSWDDEV